MTLEESIDAIRSAGSLEEANDALRLVQDAAARREATVDDYSVALRAWAAVWGEQERQRLATLPDKSGGSRAGSNWTGG